MRYKTLFFITFFTFALLTFGCGSEPEKTNLNTNTANTNTAATNTNTTNPLETTRTPEVATSNDAPTLTPVVKAYCEAVVKKDDAALRRIHSREKLMSYEKDMQDADKKSLAEFLYELDPIKDVNQCTARNEVIQGDRAVAEIRNENAPNGSNLEFVRENGEWKIHRPIFDTVQPPAANTK
jgi:phage-related protein